VASKLVLGLRVIVVSRTSHQLVFRAPFHLVVLVKDNAHHISRLVNVGLIQPRVGRPSNGIHKRVSLALIASFVQRIVAKPDGPPRNRQRGTTSPLHFFLAHSVFLLDFLALLAVRPVPSVKRRFVVSSTLARR
jgi:hypothetical protein